MKIKAWDKARNQYLPQEEFAITGDGRLLIHKNESILLYPPNTPSGNYAENSSLTIEDVEVTVEEE